MEKLGQILVFCFVSGAVHLSECDSYKTGGGGKIAGQADCAHAQTIHLAGNGMMIDRRLGISW